MSNFFYKMKFKYQRYAIKNLAVYVSVCFAIGYMLLSSGMGGSVYARFLAFFPKQVLHGQIWRILTAILYPPITGGLFNAALGILIYYSFASTVERTMGEFEYNVYFFGSLLIGELGNIIYYLLTGNNAPFLPVFTHFSVFMAFSILYAESTILLFFILPIKAKYLAIVEAALYTFYFIFGDGMTSAYGIMYTRISIIAAFIPVVLFYMFVNKDNLHGGNIFSDLKYRAQQKKRQKEWRDQWK